MVLKCQKNFKFKFQILKIFNNIQIIKYLNTQRNVSYAWDSFESKYVQYNYNKLPYNTYIHVIEHFLTRCDITSSSTILPNLEF